MTKIGQHCQHRYNSEIGMRTARKEIHMGEKRQNLHRCTQCGPFYCSFRGIAYHGFKWIPLIEIITFQEVGSPGDQHVTFTKFTYSIQKLYALHNRINRAGRIEVKNRLQWMKT